MERRGAGIDHTPLYGGIHLITEHTDCELPITADGRPSRPLRHSQRKAQLHHTHRCIPSTHTLSSSRFDSGQYFPSESSASIFLTQPPSNNLNLLHTHQKSIVFVFKCCEPRCPQQQHFSLTNSTSVYMPLLKVTTS